MIDTIIEVLIIELLVGPFMLSASDAKAQNDVLLLHEWRTFLWQSVLLSHVTLA